MGLPVGGFTGTARSTPPLPDPTDDVLSESEILLPDRGRAAETIIRSVELARANSISVRGERAGCSTDTENVALLMALKEDGAGLGRPSKATTDIG